MVRALVVDDDDALRTLVRLTLEDHGGFTVVGEASDGKQAVEKATGLRPDLIVLDLKMPVMDGFTALPLLRQASPDSIIVALSMLQQHETEANVLQLGAAAFLDKAMASDKMVGELYRILSEAVAAKGLAQARV